MQPVPCSSYDDRVRTSEESRTVVLGNLGGAWLGLVPSGIASFETNVRLPRACGGCIAAIGSCLRVTEEGVCRHMHRLVQWEPRSPDGVRIVVNRVSRRGSAKGKARIPEWRKGLASTKSLRKWFR